MRNTWKNIGAILLYVWGIIIDVLLLFLIYIAGIPVFLFSKILTFNYNEKQWKGTKWLNKIETFLHNLLP